MLQKLVLALDGSQTSMKAAEFAEGLADQFQSEVLVLHVREKVYSGAASWSPEWTPDVQESMDNVVGKLKGRGVRGLGSVSSRVIHFAQCPVLVAKEGAP
jgi:nucleotide-binding universal stress UspA family protein